MLHVTYTEAASPWLPAEELLRRVSATLHTEAEVHFGPRVDLAAEFARQFGRAPRPYSLRAWARRELGRAWVWVDHTETRDSALWLLLHELTHLELRGTGLLYAAVQAPRADDYDTDSGHEADPEEQLANHIATQGLGLLLGGPVVPMDRLWWRARVNARRMR